MGHVRLAKIPSKPNAVWIESVVIHPDLRGRGFGKYLMLICEKFAKDEGFLEAYLCTIDRQIFYSRCGYTFCDPVCAYSGNVKLPSGLTSSKPKLSDKPLSGYTCNDSTSKSNKQHNVTSDSKPPASAMRQDTEKDRFCSNENNSNNCDTKMASDLSIKNGKKLEINDMNDLAIMCAKLFYRPTFRSSQPEILEKPLRSLTKDVKSIKVAKYEICRATIPKDYMKKKL